MLSTTLSVTTSTFTLNAASGNLYKAIQPSTNYSIMITNFPTEGLANNQYTFGLMFPRTQTTYCTDVKISLAISAPLMTAILRNAGGTVPTIATSASVVLNTFTIVQLPSAATTANYAMYTCLTF
jgi:hypothetical protein